MSPRIETYNLAGIEVLVASLGLPSFRAKQLVEWLYKHGAHSYDEMKNLPSELRRQLDEVAPLSFPEIADKQISADGTRKYVLKLADGALVETVGIPSGEPGNNNNGGRLTVCFSTQVGCAMACTFCATGHEGFTRNLFPGEMVWQVLCVAQDFGQRVSNVVAMGQGEPFVNYDNVLDALRIMNSPQCLNIGARHICVSTSGICEGIRRLGDEPEQFVLAISLHSAVQDTRNALMPGLRGMPLEKLKKAIEYYQSHSGRRVSFEYLLIDGINSGEKDLAALIAFCGGLSSHVNLLPVNDIEGRPFKPCSSAHMQKWLDELSASGIEASLRKSRGADINGACGQLKNSLCAKHE